MACPSWRRSLSTATLMAIGPPPREQDGGFAGVRGLGCCNVLLPACFDSPRPAALVFTTLLLRRAAALLAGKAFEPVGILGVAAAKGKDRIGKPVGARSCRTYTHNHCAVATLFERNPIVGDSCGPFFRASGGL